MTSNQLKTPQSTKRDLAHTVAKALVSAIPVVGGPAAELFQHVIQPPLERRRLEWMNDVGVKLEELAAHGVDMDALSKNEEFISAVMHASTIAIRTHQTEKREALRNAIFNVAVGQSPRDALEHMFFEWIDSFSVLHIKILKLFQRPSPPPNMSMGGLSNVLEYNMPELRENADIYLQIWKDLYSRGLVDTSGMNTTMSGTGLAAKRTTSIGDAFIQFISKVKET